jgi:tetratricopeptide (TPR) repeat protein
LEGSGADAELVALALACLAPQAADRPRDGQAVADTLTAYLDGVQARLRKAELAEAEARARAAGEARRRRLALALAGTVLLAVALGGGTAFWLQADRQARQAQVTREVNDALGEVARLRDKARTTPADGAALFAQAREQAQRALTLVQTGPVDDALRLQVQRVKGELDDEEKDRQFLAAIDRARLAEAETEVGQNRFARERAVELFREAFRAYGLPAGEGEPAVAAARLRQRPPPVREAVNAALGEWIDLASDPGVPVPEPHLDWLRALAAGPNQGGAAEIRAARQEKDPRKRLAALEKLAAEADVRQLPAQSLKSLARYVLAAGSLDGAVALLRRARQQYPGDFWINEDLGMTLRAAGPDHWQEAVRYLTAAVSLRPDSTGAHTNLGVVLGAQRRFDEAITCHRKAIELSPKYVRAHINLASTLADQGKADEAIATYRTALDIDPKNVLALYGLARALGDQGKTDEAIAGYHKVLDIDPRHAKAHNNLGLALKNKRELDEAVARFRKALEINPGLPEAHLNLGYTLLTQRKWAEAVPHLRATVAAWPADAEAHAHLATALQGQGKLDEAIPCFHQALAMDPYLPEAHLNLGYALLAQRKPAEAVPHLRTAVEFRPTDVDAHYTLGSVLMNLRQGDEAAACLRRTIELAPGHAEAHCDLGNVLRWRGEFAAALPVLKRGHELGSRRADWKHPSAQWVSECEQMIEREKRLLLVLDGKVKPADARERLEWARFCGWTQRFAAAARLTAEAFAAEASLADDLKSGARYLAATAAVQAAAGVGRDAGGLDAGQKAGLRKLALAWLKADLAARTKLPARALADALRHWQADRGLATVRGGQALEALPDAERAGWAEFWTEVQKHLRAADGTRTP